MWDMGESGRGADSADHRFDFDLPLRETLAVQTETGFGGGGITGWLAGAYLQRVYCLSVCLSVCLSARLSGAAAPTAVRKGGGLAYGMTCALPSPLTHPPAPLPTTQTQKTQKTHTHTHKKKRGSAIED